MQSSLIGKIEKAKRYAEQKNRVKIKEIRLDFQGEHDIYQVTLSANKWTCTCSFYNNWGLCSHTMAMQRMLSDMLDKEALSHPTGIDKN